jgi:hypothetical protein
MAFFKQFPNVIYDLDKKGHKVQVKDIFRFVDVNEKLIDGASAYQYYYIKDGERPDHVAAKLYKNTDFYWTFFVVNDSLKQGYDSWPMSYQQLQTKIKTDYQPYSVLESSPSDNTILSNFNTSPRTIYVGFKSDSPVDKSWSPASSIGKFYKIDQQRNQVWIENRTERLQNHVARSGHGRLDLRLYVWNDSPHLQPTRCSPSISFRRGWQYAWQAPEEYQGANNSPKTFYEAIYNNATSNPLTYRQFETDTNELKTKIRVIKPQHIAEFAELYKRLVRL